MSYEIYKRPQAERDIEECFVFIAEENLDTGVNFLVAVEDALEQLTRFPFLGKKRDFADPRFREMRVWQVKDFEKYLIFYQVIDDRIEMIRLLHSSRDLIELFA